MAWSKVTRTLITGVANSGTVDGTGTWTSGIDLDTLVTVPPGATGAILWVRVAGSSDRWAGVRTPGKATPEFLADVNQRSYRSVLAPLGAGNTLDFYREDSTVEFHILGFTGSETVFLDVDGPRPTIPARALSWGVVDVSASVPNGAVAILTSVDGNGYYRPTGSSFDNRTTSQAGAALIPLDAARSFEGYGGTAAQPIRAYLTGGVTFAFDTDVGEDTADGTFRDSPVTNPGQSFAWVVNRAGASTTGWAARENGDSLALSVIGAGYQRGQVVPLDASGAFEVAAETSQTVDFKVDAWLGSASGGQARRAMHHYRLRRSA